jgi:hypothetical protein
MKIMNRIEDLSKDLRTRVSATTFVFPRRPVALDYEIKHINLKIFVTAAHDISMTDSKRPFSNKVLACK